MMSNKTIRNFIGSFVFRDDGNGSLTAIWQCDNLQSQALEGCRLIKPLSGGKFCGEYVSSCLLDGKPDKTALLRIEKHPSNPGLYLLSWLDPQNPDDVHYQGSALLYQDLLAGAYWT